ncbi:hypothetical protein DY000_02037012 [Brassica cretica]|uniref:Uncharacterized protein n=1 Tax=Brassica cretica TaxID=69181 RepID=A0ABQ7BI21_BRACR|nr:hypothetical protein DY000_02037012 [Brassica cretica]
MQSVLFRVCAEFFGDLQEQTEKGQSVEDPVKYRRSIEDAPGVVGKRCRTAEAKNRLKEKGERHAARVSKRERQHFGVMSERWRL